MSEANNTAVQEKPKKKRHSLWWLNLLLTLAVFAGGVVLGLMLYTMPEPYAMVEHYFPQIVPQSAAAETISTASEAWAAFRLVFTAFRTLSRGLRPTTA